LLVLAKTILKWLVTFCRFVGLLNMEMMFRKGFLTRSLLFIVFALIMACGGVLHAQWKMVSHNLLVPPLSGGVIYFNDGVLWAAGTGLYYSPDTGKTWQKGNYFGEIIYDIKFFGPDTGLVASANGLAMTTNGGKDWQPVQSQSTPWQVGFGTSASVQYYTVYVNGTGSGLGVSTDGGKSWAFQPNPDLLVAMTVDRAGTVWVTTGTGPKNPSGIDDAQLLSSTDSGNTWNAAGGLFDEDSYSIAIDSCNSSQFYLLNENYWEQGDGLSKIYVSSNGGMDWSVAFSQPIKYLNGSITNSQNAIYAGTVSDGLIRSTDKGNTWTNIGGPNIPADSRNVCAINNNIVFAIDQQENIWATFNSGGDSVLSTGTVPGILTIAPSSLFTTDTNSCIDTVTEAISIHRTGCNPPSIMSASLVGTDSLSYRVVSTGSSSIIISFVPNDTGKHQCDLVLTLDNGSTDTVALGGVTLGRNFLLTMATADRKTAILGDSVAVPIMLTGLARPENINLTLHYDSILQYQGSFDAANAKLDIAGQQWAGRSKLNIAQAQSGVIAGYAHFNVFADSGTKPQVTFDSLVVLSASSPCEYTLPSAVTSTITPPSGCGTTILSEFLKDGQIPTFTIRPNPTMGDVAITSSLDLGDAEVEIYDMLGRERDDVTVSLAKNSPVNLSMPESAGIYYLCIKSAAGISNMSVVVSK
jgi:photosystem II stability/assembly factor-like uncharacterized protein